jgi:hypothetical protein
MKKILITLLLLGAVFSFAAAQNRPAITIINNTGYLVYRVNVSQTASNSWGDNRLSSDQTLPNGQSVSIILDYPLDVVNRYDIRLVDSDGDSYVKRDVLIAAKSVITFTISDLSGSTTTTTQNSGNPSITIVNNTGYTIFYVNLSSTASDSWGSDRLGSNQTIQNGSSVSIHLDYPLNVVNQYDIRLKDSDGDTYTKWRVSVSANARIVFTISDLDTN